MPIYASLALATRKMNGLMSWQDKVKLDDMVSGGGSTVVNWVDIVSKPTTFPPSTHTHVATEVTTDSTHRFTTDADITKLSGIATGANNYVHPATHPATIIVEDSTHRWTTDTEKTTWNGKLSSVDWSIITGKPSTFAPSTHTHVATDVTQDSTHRFVFDTDITNWNGKAPIASPTFTGTLITPIIKVGNSFNSNTNGIQLGKGSGTLVNGNNNNVPISSEVSYMTFTGATSAYSVSGFGNAVDGRILVVYFNIAQTLTLQHDSTNSTSGQRITLPNGNMTFSANKPVRCIFVYDQSVGGGVGYWVLYSAIDGDLDGSPGLQTAINSAVAGSFTVGTVQPSSGMWYNVVG